MDAEKNNNRPSYIREHLKPRKKYKKIILIGIAIFVAAILLGASAGFSYAISQHYIGINQESSVEMIIIARDEMTEEETLPEETETEPSETVSETTEETKATENPESTAASEVPETTPVPTTEPVLTDAELFKKVYDTVKKGIVTVEYDKVTSPELFDTPSVDREQLFGVCFAEVRDNLYFLSDATSVLITAENKYTVNGVPASYMGVDNITHMMVLRASKPLLPNVKPMALGNSFSLNTLATVYMIGAPMNQIGGADTGYLTFLENRKDIMDGYEQNLYTNMYRLQGSSAVLVDDKCRIVGWMSDGTCKNSGSMAVASGISPLKYLLEDLVAGKDTAFLGVRGMAVTERDSEELGVPAGFYVQGIQEDSPAYRAGILQGDCIVSIGGNNIADSHALQLALDAMESGEETKIVIRRGGPDEQDELTVTTVLGGR